MKLFASRKPLLKRLYQRLVHGYYAKDLLLDLQLEAKRDSVAYIKANMADAMICPDRESLHRLAIEKVALEGLYLELGVKKGATVNVIAGMVGAQQVHGFDSFEGLPEDWAGTFLRRGKFSTGGELPKVAANVTLHPGWFENSLPQFVSAHQGPIAFVHVDCDLYSSTQTSFENLGPWIISGTVIVFDEYFNYPNWQQHEFRAFHEFLEQRQLNYQYLGFTARGGSVAVKIS